eukprot:CAMPEP_0201546798 /NCGR_PEP_ID=MMETSP0173_2-20130828/3166_1 /ASSEMBLY_ACC=CAM_ASM_000268 /TAXON_ID=218659 /ORGANISM="Vexillifera sp., Strain DIVA3 564/2" /LENGTH=278 /DNA_ID=CAMNT_0047955587 /DNA_START=161 /DNA_END=997 /DNA_ORIENTATION=-
MGSQVNSSQMGSSQERKKTKSLLVLGGNGFVGSAICKYAIDSGKYDRVKSLSRSGEPPTTSGEWKDQVQWLKGDVFKGDEWDAHLDDVQSVVSCIGAFGTDEQMERICGDANIHAVDTVVKHNEKVAEEKAANFGFISAHQFSSLPSFVLHGYYNGKKRAEQHILQKFGAANCMILRCPFIYGQRDVTLPVSNKHVSLPLNMVGVPLEKFGHCDQTKAAKKALPFLDFMLTPSVSVDEVAAVMVNGLQQQCAEGGHIPSGILDVYEIHQHGERLIENN